MVQCFATVPKKGRRAEHQCENQALVGEIHCIAHASVKEKRRREALGAAAARRDTTDRKTTRPSAQMLPTARPPQSGHGTRRVRPPSPESASHSRSTSSPRPLPPPPSPSPESLPSELRQLVLEKLGVAAAVAAGRRPGALSPGLRGEFARQQAACGFERCHVQWRRLFVGYYDAEREREREHRRRVDEKSKTIASPTASSSGLQWSLLRPNRHDDDDDDDDRGSRDDGAGHGGGGGGGGGGEDAKEERKRTPKRAKRGAEPASMTAQDATSCRTQWCLADTAPIEAFIGEYKRDYGAPTRGPWFLVSFNSTDRTAPAPPEQDKPMPSRGPPPVCVDVEFRRHDGAVEGGGDDDPSTQWTLIVEILRLAASELGQLFVADDAAIGAAVAFVSDLWREIRTDDDANESSADIAFRVARRSAFDCAFSFATAATATPDNDRGATRSFAQLIRALSYAFSAHSVTVRPSVQAQRHLRDHTLGAYLGDVNRAFPRLSILVRHDAHDPNDSQIVEAIGESALAVPVLDITQ